MVLRADSGDREFKRIVIGSLLFHLSVIAFFAVKVAFFDSQTINYQASIRVDLVGLPDKQMPEHALAPASPPPKSESQSAPASPTPVALSPTQKTKPIAIKDEAAKKPNEAIDLKTKQKLALDQLKALQELKQDAQKAKDAGKPAPPIKGNAIATGTSLRGINKMDYDTYIGDVDAHIKAQWALPEWLSNANLRARVRVKIDEKGYVTEKRLVLSSGNQQYDALAVDAVTRASPFPPPPEKFINIVGIDGIIFQFPD